MSPPLSSEHLLPAGWRGSELTRWIQPKPPAGGSLDTFPPDPADASTRTGQGPTSIISRFLEASLAAGQQDAKHGGPGNSGSRGHIF